MNIDKADHNLRCGALFDRQQSKQIIVIDLMNQSVQLNIVIQMLTTPSARQMDKLLTVFTTFLTEVVENSFDVHFLQQTLRRVLKLTDLHWQFLDFIFFVIERA